MSRTVLAAALLFTVGGCPKPATTTTPPPATAKPVATAKATKDAPKKLTELKSKKPLPVPEDWDRMVDAVKGFAFYVPKGSESKQETEGGVDVFVAQVAKPHDIAVMCVVYKDASKSKDDLAKNAVDIITSMGDTDVKVLETEELNADYTLLTITSVDEQKVKSKTRALVATDITDNYLLFVVSPETAFDQNVDTVDAIWQSFEMFSGGASGESK
ncbi:MAG: hypothetical protein HY908_06600 [Myxococcales bacterium]|nr:hypothetical protein [Myxococcales bacterium]